MMIEAARVVSHLGEEVDTDSGLVHVVEAIVHKSRNQSSLADCRMPR